MPKKTKQQFDPRLPQPLVAGGVTIPVIPHYSSWMAPYWWGYAGGMMGTITDGSPENNQEPVEGATDADGAVV